MEQHHQLIVFFIFSGIMVVADASTLVPGIMTFGDSSVDVGNNNDLRQARFKANYWPYGKDFSCPTQSPSGRFSNGMLASDFTGKTNETILHN